MTHDEIDLLLSQLRAFHQRQRTEQVTVEGLSATSMRVLGAIARHDGVQPSQLARELIMTTSNIAAALRELDGRGLVSRSTDDEDSRRVIVDLTAEGRRVVAAVRESRNRWLQSAIAAGLTPEEQATLLAAGRVLARLAES